MKLASGHLLQTWRVHTVPDSKVHGANMGPAWVLSAPDGPHVGPTSLALRGASCIIELYLSAMTETSAEFFCYLSLALTHLKYPVPNYLRGIYWAFLPRTIHAFQWFVCLFIISIIFLYAYDDVIPLHLYISKCSYLVSLISFDMWLLLNHGQLANCIACNCVSWTVPAIEGYPPILTRKILFHMAAAGYSPWIDISYTADRSWPWSSRPRSRVRDLHIHMA